MTCQFQSDLIEILLVEDNPGDARLTREVLSQVKEDAELKSIPVVVLTTSSGEQDILQSYNLYVKCYITKPVDLQFMKIVNLSSDFWLEIVKLPSHA